MMIDQIIIGGRASFDDFGASVAGRAKNAPKKKEIKEKVPFSNITYDFTKINGEIFWEERELEYDFEMIAPDPVKLEDMRTAFESWILNIIQEELHDPIIPDYHYIVTYADVSYTDDEGLEKTTAKVKFTAYPYKVANVPRVYEHSIPANGTKTVWVQNDSSHKITPTITADKAVTFTLGGVNYTMNAGTVKDYSFKLAEGLNELSIANANSAACAVSISFYEEVF